MRLALDPEEQRLRDEVRAFLDEQCPDPESLPHDLDARIAALREWQRQLYEAGYVGRAWPAAFGGGGRPTAEQIVVDRELAAAGAPELVAVVGLDVLGPALLAFGSDEQKRRHVGPILSADEIWSQGFSEPEAGSDLASLRTSAVETDAGWVLNGQKTWISWGQFSRWCGVLARTDPDVPRHKGISLFILDMESPGIDLRPMVQITGHAEFCEMFLDDVVVPKENMLGERGQGWKIAMHVVAHERGTAAVARQVTLRTWFDRLVTDTASTLVDDAPLLDDARVQAALAQALVEIEALRHHASRTMSPFLNGDPVGPESSTVKLLLAKAEQTLGETALELLGDAGSAGFWQERYLYSRAASVYGGTRQIQRSIIADRILALPQE
jgi:alkylation response protein AidB-like acyl-CoA dehydrogenase